MCQVGNALAIPKSGEVVTAYNLNKSIRRF